MESKKNIFYVILMLAVIGGCGFGIYTMIKNSNEEEKETTTAPIQNNQDNTSSEGTTTPDNATGSNDNGVLEDEGFITDLDEL